ncbi:hypothetical protein TrVE_jg9948 [Triparma verrucosa]|uniref:AB hydrolase-1 domain-containing protein n=1 Tax=Triparma verrucosa TaxID=1606542 RepID=A0A9W7BQV8_9STRA|nr:hypothetical protein TrVE_jg9948 [Triparma verrucosa]
MNLRPSLLHALSSLSPPAAPFLHPILNRRYAYYPPQTQSSSSPPPLLLLGGTSQSISSWSPHVSQLSKSRLVIAYECCGQGPSPPLSHETCAIESQVSTLEKFVNGLNLEEVDVAGLSFGSRVGLAFSRTGKVNKLHVSGLTRKRDDYSMKVLEDWRGILSDGSDEDHGILKRFAESVIDVSYSEGFKEKNSKWREKWEEFVVNNNTVEGLRGLLNQSHAGVEDEWGVTKSLLASRSENRFIVGEVDVLCGAESEKGVKGAMEELRPFGQTKVFEGCGHAVPMEMGKAWRDDLLEFLT